MVLQKLLLVNETWGQEITTSRSLRDRRDAAKAQPTARPASPKQCDQPSLQCLPLLLSLQRFSYRYFIISYCINCKVNCVCISLIVGIINV